MSILFSLKLPRELSNDDIKAKLQNNLPDDIKIFDVQDASKSFDAKARTTNRTYYYYIPAFCLNNTFFNLISVKLKNEIDEIFMKDIYND